MSKDVRNKDSWEKTETAGRFIRDIVIVGVLLAGAFAWYYKTSQDRQAANETARVARDLLLKDDPKAYLDAEAKLKEVLEKYDDSHGYSLAALAELNAILYLEHGVAERKGPANEFVAKAGAEKTNTPEEFAARTLMMVADGKAAEAEQYLTREVLEKGAGGAKIFAALGIAQRKQGKLEDARRAFKAAIDADWRNPRFATLIGENYLDDGDFNNAQSYFQRGLQSNSEHLGSVIGAARARLRAGTNLDEAEKHINTAFAREADLTPRLKARALVARAELEMVQGKLDEAIATAHSAAQTDPTFGWAFAVKARAEAKKAETTGDAELAKSAATNYDKAIAADPNVPHFYYEAAQVIGAFDPNRALAFLEKYPLKKDDRYYLEYGNAFRGAGKLDEAIAQYDLGIGVNVANGKLYLAKGSIFRSQGKQEEAQAAFDLAERAQPLFPELYAERAMLLFDKKQYEEGLQEYAKALTQWRQTRKPQEYLVGAITNVRDLLRKAGQRQYAEIWEREATELIR